MGSEDCVYTICRHDGRVQCFNTCGDSVTAITGIGRHSLDGFEYGYGGSGPSELALAILTDFAPDVADELYQRFKWDFIANRDRDKDFEISGADIQKWLNNISYV